MPMRDGIRLATDVYRPARDGEPVDGRFPTILCRTPYDKTDRRYTEIADFFVPRGYAVVLQDLRDRYRSEGTRRLRPQPHPAPGPRRLRHGRVDRGAPWSERPRRHGRQLVRRDHAGSHGARAAAAPGGDLARRRAHEQLPAPVPRGRRDAAAHVLGALHPRAGRAGHRRTTRPSRTRSGATFRDARALLATPSRRADRAPAHADAREGAARLLHARRLRRVLGAGERLHRATSTRTPTSRARSRPAGSTPSRTPTRSTSRRWRRRTTRRSGSSSGRGATSACAATRPRRSTSTSGPTVWGVQRYFDEQLAFFDRRLRDGAAAHPRRGAGADLRHGRRHGPQDRRRQARPRRPLARRAGVAARPGGRQTAPPARRRLAAREAAGGRPAAPLHLRPGAPGADHRRPPLRGRRAAGRRPGDGADVGAPPQPGAAPAQRPHAGPADQRETPELFGAREPYPLLRERPDVLVFETEPLAEPSR